MLSVLRGITITAKQLNPIKSHREIRREVPFLRAQQRFLV